MQARTSNSGVRINIVARTMRGRSWQVVRSH